MSAPATVPLKDPVQRPWLFPFVVCSAAAIAYSAVPSFGFVFDDRIQILNNPTLLHLNSIPQYFLHHVWNYVPGMAKTYYRPVFSTWLNVNYALFAQHAAGWHIFLLGVHLLVSLLTYYLVSNIFGDRRVGMVAALLFAVHPVHVESVAWISGGTDPVAAALVLGSFLLYSKAQQCRGWKQALLLAGSLALFLCSLFTKETVLLFPVVLLLGTLLLVPKDQQLRSAVSTFPYFLAVIVYVFVRIATLGSFGQVHVQLPLAAFFYTLPSVLLDYLRLILFPAGLSPFYDTPYVDRPVFFHFWVPLLVMAAFIILVCAGVARLTAGHDDALANRKQCVFLLGWTLLFLVPALDLNVLDPGEIVHDRYLYCSSIGVLAVLAFILVRSADRLSVPSGIRSVAGVILVILLALMTATQSYYWKNDFVLYRRGAAMAPENVNAQSNLATIYLETGHYDEGIALHKKILQARPDYVDSYYNIGMAYYNQSNFPLAEEYLRHAAVLKPDPSWYFYLGLAQFKNAHPSSAEASLKQAVQGGPNRPEFHAALGFIYENEGKADLALREFEAAQQLNPSNQAVAGEILRLRSQLRR